MEGLNIEEMLVLLAKEFQKSIDIYIDYNPNNDTIMAELAIGHIANELQKVITDKYIFRLLLEKLGDYCELIECHDYPKSVNYEESYNIILELRPRLEDIMFIIDKE